jgi:hypothetical protein
MVDGKYSYLNNDIQSNFFVSDWKLAKQLVDKYKIKASQRQIKDHIYRVKSIINIYDVLYEKIKPYENGIMSIELSERYYNKYLTDPKTKTINKTIKILRSENNEPFIINWKQNIKSPGIDIYGNTKDFEILKNITERKEKLTNLKNSKFIEDPYFDTNYLKEKILKEPIEEEIVRINKRSKSNNNILIIGDIHCPFDLEEYFDFCKKIKKKYNTNKIIFIGDILDNHYSSFHSTDPDGFSAGEELDRAIYHLKRWYKEFPEATVILGNHDLNVERRLFDCGISKRWMRDFNEILEVSKWKFINDQYEYQDIIFTHGTGVSGVNAAHDIALYRNKSTVIGHLHTQSSVIYVNGNIYGMCVGCGIDFEKYAFNYARNYKKRPILSCGVIYEGIPIIETLR